jgi:ACS family tartrate transporter-like MFS transporter
VASLAAATAQIARILRGVRCTHEGEGDVMDRAVLRKVTWRLVPFMALLYFVNYLDRVNVGFAALTMNQDLGFSATMFGTGAGILFLGYVIFQVPSNLALERIGVRHWIAGIMVVWGIVSSATAFVIGPMSFYALRFSLGVAEAGFFPGMILYLTYWFPYGERAKMTALFMMAIPVSSVLGAPVSTALLDVGGLGLKGWQWLFILQGVPAILLGIAVLGMLTENPDKARWLTVEEKATLKAALAVDRHARDAAHSYRIGQIVANPRFWLFGLMYFGVTVCLYGLTLWLPQIIKSLGSLTNAQVGLVTALPYAVGTVSMYFWSAHADATGERAWHLALPLLGGAIALIASGYLIDRPIAAFIALMLAAIGVYTALPSFWALPTAMLGSSAAAGGIAMCNAIGNIGGYAGPQIIGSVKDATQSYADGLLALAAFAILSAVLAVVMGPARPALDPATAPAAPEQSRKIKVLG